MAARARGVGVSMNDKYDGTRMIHGECRLEATSPWADDVVLDGLRLHLDLHILPRRSRTTSGRGASATLRRAGASARALCFGISRRPEWALVAGIGVLAIALWSSRGPSGSHAQRASAAPGVAKTPDPSPLPPRAARPPMAPPPSVAPIPPELTVPPRASSPSPALPTSRAPNEEPATGKAAAASESAPASRGCPPRASRQILQPAPSSIRTPAIAAKPPRPRAMSDGAASVAAPPMPPARSTADMLDLFGDTK